MEMTTIGHPFPGPERVSAYRHPVRGFLWTPARISGVTSLVLQVVSLVVSFFLLGALFMHIGGGKLLKIGGGHNETTTNETETSAGGLLNGGRIYPTLTPGALYQEFENAAQKNISLFGPMETNLDVGRGMDDNSSWMNNNFTANESKMLDPFRDDKQVRIVNCKLPNNNLKSSKIQVHFTEKELDMLKASGTSQPISETLSNIVEGGKSTAANQKTTTDDALEFFTARTETLVPNVTEPSSVQLLQGPFEQVEPVRSKIGHVEFDLVGLLRNLCFVDTGLSVLWFLSIMCLLISLRHEVPDLIYINLLVLIIVTIFVIIFAGLVAVLLLYEV